MRAFIFICVMLAAASARHIDIDIDFAGNISDDIRRPDHDDHSFDFRHTEGAGWENGFFFISRAMNANASASNSSGSGSADWDTIAAMAMVSSANPPLSWFAYFSFDLDIGGAASDWAKLDVSHAEGFMANAYVALIEHNSTDDVVRRISLKPSMNPFARNSIVWEKSDPVKKGELTWLSLSGTYGKENWTIQLTWIISNVVGVLDYGDAIVGPKILECVIEIDNYTYAADGNYLGLVVAAATGNADWKEKTIVNNGNNTDNNVYFTLSGTAEVDGTEDTDVSIGEFANSTWDATFESPAVAVQIAGAFRHGFDVKVTEVTFPAGAQSIVYDPATGNGADPYTSSSSSSKNSNAATIAIAVCVSVAVVAAIAVVVTMLVLRHRRNYVAV